MNWISDATNLDSNAAGAPGTETLQTVLGVDSLNLPTVLVSGTFTITTNVGTLTGTAEGEFDVGILSELPQRVAAIDGGLLLTVTSGTGQFAGTTGTLGVGLQYPTFGSDFFNGRVGITPP